MRPQYGTVGSLSPQPIARVATIEIQVPAARTWWELSTSRAIGRNGSLRREALCFPPADSIKSQGLQPPECRWDHGRNPRRERLAMPDAIHFVHRASSKVT